MAGRLFRIIGNAVKVFALVGIITGSLFFLGKTILGIRPLSTVVSPVPDAPQQLWSLPFFPKKDPQKLQQTIKKLVDDTWKNYSVFVVDYNSDFSAGINDAVIFTGASIDKLPILVALYTQAQAKKIDLDENITLQQEDIQDYGTGTIRADPPGTTYSVKTLARLMMQKSDNTAAYIIGNHIVGIDTIQALATSWGMDQTDIANNKTSNKDIARLFRKLYEGKIVNGALTQEIFSFLKDSDFEDRIPALLPRDAVVYHKTGNGTGGIHDAGIIILGKTKYYLGIFTADVVDDQEAIALEAKVSKAVFDFMQ